MSVDVEALIESPWDAEEALATLSPAERTAVRTQLLKHAAEDGKHMDSGVPSCLKHFADADVLAALSSIVASGATGDVIEAAVESIGALAESLPAAGDALRTLITHDNNGVARVAIEHLRDSAEPILSLLLPLVDSLAARGDDHLMKVLVDRLVEANPTHPEVLAALARHWSFSIVHDRTLMASNAIFDALIEHAPQAPEAQAVFVAAAAHEHEYARVRGLGALALTTPEPAKHVKALKALKGLAPSSSSLRKRALDTLAKRS